MADGNFAACDGEGSSISFLYSSSNLGSPFKKSFLVVDADLEAGGAPVHELDAALGLDGGDGGSSSSSSSSCSSSSSSRSSSSSSSINDDICIFLLFFKNDYSEKLALYPEELNVFN